MAGGNMRGNHDDDERKKRENREKMREKEREKERKERKRERGGETERKRCPGSIIFNLLLILRKKT